MGNTVHIQALKYGNVLHYEWETELLEQRDDDVFVLAKHGRQLRHHTKNATFTINNWSIEWFSRKHWFTLSAVVADGRITEYYCNINQPALIGEGKVAFVDLDLDLVQRDGVWMVVDEDEFAHNAIKFGYPESLIAQAREELKRLQARIAAGEYPFDGTLEEWISHLSLRDAGARYAAGNV
ncbi:DUF402 domain-containing protein [Paenibacillus sp. strain BS8-2]